MEQLIPITGTETERIVLVAALHAYSEHARKRIDPYFIPKLGKVDRNKEAMALAAGLLEQCDRNQSRGIAGLRVETTDKQRRALRQALQTFAAKSDASGVIDGDASVAMELFFRIPNTTDELGGGAIVEHRSRF